MDSRVKGNFMRSPTRKAKPGKSPRHATSTKSRRKVRKKRSMINQLGLVALIAFIFFTPDARQFVLAKWAEIEDYVMEGLAPHQVYPLEADYTVVRSIDLWNNGSGVGHLEESIPLPLDVTSNEGGAVALAYEDGTEVQKSNIQEVINIELRIDGEVISIPKDGVPTKQKSEAVVTAQGNEIWWPGQGDGSDKCKHGACVRVSIDVPSGTHETVDFAVTLKSKSYTWWHSTRVDGKIDGKSEGTSLARSGTFADIAERGMGSRSNTFASTLNWYDRGGTEGWAIDARSNTAPTVYQTAASIDASLPTNLKTNAYAFARATFDWLNEHVPYDTNAPNIARGGEQCLVAGMGDCDEQSNAFMSIMRHKGIPTWYVFGALTDSNFENWEGHAWAYILLPMSNEWCEQKGVVIETCFVEGAVDVVNRKWLVHTPTVYIDWIEKAPWTNVDGYYSGGSMQGNDFKRLRSFFTEGYEISGGTWNNKWIGEDLS